MEAGLEAQSLAYLASSAKLNVFPPLSFFNNDNTITFQREKR